MALEKFLVDNSVYKAIQKVCLRHGELENRSTFNKKIEPSTCKCGRKERVTAFFKTCKLPLSYFNAGI